MKVDNICLIKLNLHQNKRYFLFWNLENLKFLFLHFVECIILNAIYRWSIKYDNEGLKVLEEIKIL